MPPKRKTKSKPRVVKPKRALERYPRAIPIRKSVRIPKPIFREEKHAEYLLGPVRLSILEHPRTTQRIILLGDVHVADIKCPTSNAKKSGVFIYRYLQELFENYKGSEFIDLFLEENFSLESRWPILDVHRQELKEDKFDNPYLFAVQVQFENCLQRIKTQCEFYGKPIRFHYSDVRNGVIHSGTDEKTKQVVKQLRDLWKTSIQDDPQFKARHVRFLLQLISKLKNDDIDFLFRFTKIDKQLKHIVNKDIVAALREYTMRGIHHRKQYFEEYGQIGNHFLEQLKRKEPLEFKTEALHWMKHYGEEKVITFKTFVHRVLGQDLSVLFDVYTMARMFRHYMTQVIIYAGDAHIRHMRIFLILILGFKEIVHRESGFNSKTFQCISLKGVHQPWFQ